MSLVILWLVGWALAALLLAILLVPHARTLASRLQLIDQPDGERRLHRAATPRAGGIAIYCAFAAVIVGAMSTAPGGAAISRPLLWALVGGGGLLFITGLVDDRYGVRPRVKLAAQLAAAVIAWAVGLRFALPWAASPVLAFAITTLWVLAVSNAYNLIDGMDGLAGVVAISALTCVCGYVVLTGNTSVLLPSVVLAAAMIGFLKFNLPPATVFLGDCGSLFIGYALALLTLAAVDGARPTAWIVLPLCALAVPLLDTGASVVRRWLRHVPVARADARHIHHRLAALGYGPRGVCAVVVMVSAAFGAFGLVFGAATREMVLAIGLFGAVLLTTVLVYGSSRLAYHEFGEALNILLAAPRRARRVIRTQIALRDLVHELGRAEDPFTVRALVSRHTDELGLLEIALVRGDGALAMRKMPQPLEAWCLVYPLAVVDESGAAQCLVLTASRGPLADAGTAERVARSLAGALEEWFAAASRWQLQHGLRPIDQVANDDPRVRAMRVRVPSTGVRAVEIVEDEAPRAGQYRHPDTGTSGHASW